MERYDISEGGRFAEMVDAARAGAEVEITEGGTVVARVVRPEPLSFRERLEAHWRSLPPEVRDIDWLDGVSRTRHEEWQ